MPLSIALACLLVTGALAGDGPFGLADDALAVNPGLASLDARVRELEALASTADAWPDPMAALEYSNVPTTSWALDGHPMAGLQLKAQQTIPFPGVSSLRAEVAESRVEVAEAELAEARLRLVRAVEESWWRLVLVRQLRQITREHVALTEDLVGAVRARYEIGAAGQHALVRLELLRDELRDSLLDFDRQEQQIEGALAAAAHRRSLDDLTTPDTVAARTLRPDDGVEAWLVLAEQRRPALAQLEAMERSAELRARLARRDAKPDLTVWAGYRVRTVQTATDPGTDLASLGLSVPLTIQSARVGRGAESAALEAASQARWQREAQLDAIHADLISAWAAWQRAEGKAQTYTDRLLPAGQQALATTLADYRVDKADFASLYQAEVQLLNLERARLAAVVETHLQQAAVRAITGDTTRPTGADR